MLVGVRRDQARVHSKALAADKIGRDAGRNDALEHAAEKITITEPFVAGARKRRVIGQLVLDAQTTEPAIGEIDLDLAAQGALRADGEHIADDEHPDLEAGSIEGRSMGE